MTTTKIELSESEKASLTRMLAESAQAKELLVQKTLASHNANKERDVVAEALLNVDRGVTQRLNEILKDNHVDPTSPESGRWNFDISTMKLTRADIPSTPAVPDTSSVE